ncbi:MAG: murein biosynthesis integral membrane protein MurJ [Planctomycetota bacterium]
MKSPSGHGPERHGTDPARAGAERAGDARIVVRHGRLVRRTALVSVLTLMSRVLGFVREMIAAALFGDGSGIYDAFITAWRVPNLFRRFLGEGAISTSFQTALTEVDGDHGDDAGRALFWSTARMLTAILVAVTVIVMALVVVMPDAMPFTGWRWLGADPAPVRELTIRLMPFVLFVCLAALVSGGLQVRGIFGAPAWAPAVLNVVWLVTLALIVLRFGRIGPAPAEDGGLRHLEMSRWLAWGALASGLAQLVVQLPALRRAGLWRGPRVPLPRGVSGPSTVLRRALPLAFGAAVYQVNVMIDGFMAEGLLANGGPTIHYLANRVQQFPLALVAVAATSAVFPALQALGHVGDRAALRKLHDRTHLAIALVALPASVGLAVLARPFSEAVFGHGAFGPEGVARTALTLQFLCIAILPAGATGLIARAYYALGDFKTPVRVSALLLLVNVSLNVVFLVWLGFDVEGLALATAVTSWLNVLLLWPGLTRRLGLPGGRQPFAAPLARIAAASLLSGAVAHVVYGVAGPRLGDGLGVFTAISLAMVSYGLAATALRAPGAVELAAKLRRRFSP